MELARYRPDESIRWLRFGADEHRADARDHAKRVKDPAKRFSESLREAATSIYEYGKGAYTGHVHDQAEGHEYVLQAEHFDIVAGKTIKSIPYGRVKALQLRGDRVTVILDSTTFVIKPVAYLSAGRAKVPVGWQRNGLDVPFRLLAEELAARCGVELTESES
ncbi:MAG: hypothetical protein SFX74_11525 [Fimbriimonadaceae bacterium]|nr:hypothetical protein [Fimbriimonadaceae bacterium]